MDTLGQLYGFPDGILTIRLGKWRCVSFYSGSVWKCSAKLVSVYFLFTKIKNCATWNKTRGLSDYAQIF